MGLFSKNWAKELDRVEELLVRDLPVPALELAERAERKAEPDLQARAAGLVLRARQALLRSVLAKAGAAEAEGALEDAADWLLSAIENEPSPVRRAELEARRQALVDRRLDADSPLRMEAVVTVLDEEYDDSADGEFQYETLVSMLSDDMRPRYENRPAEFRQAFVDLNEGQGGEALAVLERLGEQNPGDGVLRLELGRARLLAGDTAGACEDLAVAWEELGDEPLDSNGSLLAPALWAEAALASGQAADVVTRLEPLAAPATGDPDLCLLYATALLAGGQVERAVAYLDEVTALLPSHAELNLLMAQALAASGETERAIAGLERAVAPSCAGGGCAQPAAHLPSFRALARLHLDHGGDAERACELMARVANAQRGFLGAEDHFILADYYRASGDSAAAEDAAAEGERLAAEGAGAVAAVEPDLGPRRRRVL